MQITDQQRAIFIQAQHQSLDHKCAKHVNSAVTVINNTIEITFYVSDWYVSGSTVASFSNGEAI